MYRCGHVLLGDLLEGVAAVVDVDGIPVPGTPDCHLCEVQVELLLHHLLVLLPQSCEVVGVLVRRFAVAQFLEVRVHREVTKIGVIQEERQEVRAPTAPSEESDGVHFWV